MSRHASVSLTPNTNLPVSCAQEREWRGVAEGKWCELGGGPPGGPASRQAARPRKQPANQPANQPAPAQLGGQHSRACEIWSKKEEISRFSCTNLTLASVSADSSMAWLKPFSPPAQADRRAGGQGGRERRRRARRASEGSTKGGGSKTGEASVRAPGKGRRLRACARRPAARGAPPPGATPVGVGSLWGGRHLISSHWAGAARRRAGRKLVRHP